jgi:hypothetical protein
MQSFNNYISRWWKKPQWKNDYISFSQCFLLVIPLEPSVIVLEVLNFDRLLLGLDQFICKKTVGSSRSSSYWGLHALRHQGVVYMKFGKFQVHWNPPGAIKVEIQVTCSELWPQRLHERTQNLSYCYNNNTYYYYYYYYSSLPSPADR